MPVARLIKITAIEVLGLLGRRLITISFVVTAVGCVSVPERHPLPPDLVKQAGIPGVPNALFWGSHAVFAVVRVSPALSVAVYCLPRSSGVPHAAVLYPGKSDPSVAIPVRIRVT